MRANQISREKMPMSSNTQKNVKITKKRHLSLSTRAQLRHKGTEILSLHPLTPYSIFFFFFLVCLFRLNEGGKRRRGGGIREQVAVGIAIDARSQAHARPSEAASEGQLHATKFRHRRKEKKEKKSEVFRTAVATPNFFSPKKRKKKESSKRKTKEG